MSEPDEEISDQSLLRRFQKGQPDASTLLYLRYAGRLQALATKQRSADLAARVDPEDVVQSVFRTFFRRAAKGEYAVPDGEEIWKLLLVIALNKVRTAAVHHHAAKRDTRKTTGGEAYNRALENATGTDESALTILKLVIEETLDRLPTAQRAMIELRIDGFDVAEIAARVGRSKRTVERVLQEFRSNLGSSLEQEE